MSIKFYRFPDTIGASKLNLSIKILSNILFSDISAEVGLALMRWVYTDKAEIKNEENFLVDLVKAANRYKLTELRGR